MKRRGNQLILTVIGNILGILLGLVCLVCMVVFLSLTKQRQLPEIGDASFVYPTTTPVQSANMPPTLTHTPQFQPTGTPPSLPTATPSPTVTPTSQPTGTPTPTGNGALPQIESGVCAPNKCHIQGFNGGLLLSAYGKTMGIFSSGQWSIEEISDQEAQAVEHFKCPNKPDLDTRVKWGFNIAYCRFYERGMSLGEPFDEGRAIEGEVFKTTSRGIVANLQGLYGLNSILIKGDGTWEFYEPPTESQKASITIEPGKNAFAFGEHVSMCFYLAVPAPAKATIHNANGDVLPVLEWSSLGPDGECIGGPMAAGYGHNRLVLEALDVTSASAVYEFDVY